MPEKIFAAVCILWSFGIVWKQVHPRTSVFWSRFDVLWIFPSYRYFAPTPNFHDYVLQYRTTPGDDTSWQAITLYPTRSVLTALWHPNRLRIEVLERHMETVLNRVRQRREVGLQSRAFRSLLAVVTDHATPTGTVSCQIRILVHQSRSISSLDAVAFQSQWHDLP